MAVKATYSAACRVCVLDAPRLDAVAHKLSHSHSQERQQAAEQARDRLLEEVRQKAAAVDIKRETALHRLHQRQVRTRGLLSNTHTSLRPLRCAVPSPA